MRSINKEIKLTKQIIVTDIAINEDFRTILKDKYNKVVTVEVVTQNKDGVVVTENEYYDITGDNYDLLMSESPDFAPNKPVNDFREEDLWFIIDRIRAEKSLIE
ncbi:hypothetical protein AAHH67_15085 [Niallia circulans]